MHTAVTNQPDVQSGMLHERQRTHDRIIEHALRPESVLHFLKGYYTFSIRIEINNSAKRHGITDAEIRAVISYLELRFSLVARIGIDAAPVLHIGRAADNQPHIEVIADLIDPAVAVVFHAMMLRPKLVNELGLDLFITPDYRPQRA
jgi:hypothetical protein